MHGTFVVRIPSGRSAVGVVRTGVVLCRKPALVILIRVVAIGLVVARRHHPGKVGRHVLRDALQIIVPNGGTVQVVLWQ